MSLVCSVQKVNFLCRPQHPLWTEDLLCFAHNRQRLKRCIWHFKSLVFKNYELPVYPFIYLATPLRYVGSSPTGIELVSLALEAQSLNHLLDCQGSPKHFKKLICIGVYFIYNVVSVSAIQQSESVIHMHILFHILSPYRLLHSIEKSSLCYTVCSH